MSAEEDKKEINFSPESKNEGGVKPPEIIERAPENIADVLSGQAFELNKGEGIIMEGIRKDEMILKACDADEENTREFLEGRDAINQKAREAKDAYRKEVEKIMEDDAGAEDRIDGVVKEKSIKKEEKEMEGKESIFVQDLEKQGLLGEEIKEEYLKIKSAYKQKLITENKNPKEGETWDELIMQEMDKNYAELIKTKVGERDKKIIDEFQESSEEKMMPLKHRQEFLNTLLKNPNKFYASKSGETVSLSDYLKNYYKGIGVSIEIKFKTIDPDVKKSLAGNLLRDEFLFMGLDNKTSYEKSHQDVEIGDKKISYILNDEVAIPHLIVERENLKKEIPLIAGSRDLHMPLRSEKKDEAGERERKGHFIQSQVVHAPKSACTIQKIVAFNIHEIDHTIKEIMPTKDQNELDQRFITEGTAEKANIDFMDTQHKYLKDNSAIKKFDGYDYQAVLQQVLGRNAVGEKSSNGLEYRYVQGYALAKGYEGKEGEEKYKKLFYTGELNINEELGDVVKIREKIDEKFIKQKDLCKEIMLGKLDEEK